MHSNKIALPGLTRDNSSKMSNDNSTVVSKGEMANKYESARSMFPKGKNPFHMITYWTPEMLALIDIQVSQPIETTNDFTRSKQRAARYWSSEVKFSYTDPDTNKEFTSGLIKMEGCDIPRVDSPSYGGDFFYATCNRAIGDAVVAAAAKKNITVTIDDEKTVSNQNQWWKTINKAKGRIGVLEPSGNFEPRDIHKVMLKTEAGIKAALDVSIKLKFNTKDGGNMKPTSEFRIVFDLSRGLIRALRNDVAPPPIETSVETAPVSRKDVASEELLNELDALEI